LRKHQLHVDEQIAAAAAQRGNAVTRKPEPLPALGAGWNPETNGRAVRDRHVNLTAEDCRVHGDWNRAHQAVPFTSELRLWMHVASHVEVAGPPPVPTCVPFLGDANARAVREARRYVDGNCFCPDRASKPRAGRAGLECPPSRTLTGAARFRK